MYAKGTEVPVERSRAEIEKILTRYKATGFVFGWQGGQAAIMFEMANRRVKFVLPLPQPADFARTKQGHSRSPSERERACDQARRERWRSFALVIKAKLESVESGIAVFDEEFMPWIVMPDGKTIGEHIKPKIEQAYIEKKMPPLLPGPS
jgi:hypothetical protein